MMQGWDLTPERWAQIDAAFREALERAPGDRRSFLNQIGLDDEELRQAVEQLLANAVAAEAEIGESVSEYAEPFLSELKAALREDEAPTLPPNARIGPYRILRELGRGGMGAVYLAERADGAFEKQVALKLVKRGMDTDEVLRRFRWERRILASLEHPHIARLYDGGASEDGRPFLVMEYIEGQPITAYCDGRRMTVEARLRLFTDACEAVQFAHQNLVIHRDIKPSNILVASDGTVKLLDFGIAKLLASQDPEAEVPTRRDMRLLTPEYAAPEQLAGEAVTTASDVYALGVVLHELVTGRRPERLHGRMAGAPDPGGAGLRIDLPSSVLARSSQGASAALHSASQEELAVLRGTTPDQLRRALRGDLDTILTRSLAEEPERRYQSAEQLLADIQRFLGGYPVLARGDSAAYRFGKFLGRHRWGVGVVATLILVVSGFTVSTVFQAQEVSRARAVAEGRQGQAEDLIGFMLGDLRGKLSPVGQLDLLRDVGHQALDYFAAVPADQLSDQELFRRSEALRLLGEVQRGQGDREAAAHTFGEALTLARALVERDPLHTGWQLGLATSHGWLGVLRFEEGDAEGALAHWTEYQDITERIVEQAPDSLNYRLELTKAVSNMGSYLERAGDREAALRLYHRVLEERQWLVAQETDEREFQTALATAYNKVAMVQMAEGRLASALEGHRSELEVRRRVVTRDPNNAHELRSLALAHGFLAELAVATGDEEEGLEHRLSAWRIHEALVERDPTNVTWQLGYATTARLAGVGLLHSGERQAALEALNLSRDVLRRLLEQDPRRVDALLELAKAETELAAALRLGDQPNLAPETAWRALEVIEPVRAALPDHLASRRVEGDAELELGRALSRLGRHEEARHAWERALEAIRPAAEQAGTVGHLSTLGFALLYLDRLDEAQVVVDSLLAWDYRRADFLGLAREKGVVSSETLQAPPRQATAEPTL